MKDAKANVFLRLVAFAVDWLILAVWGSIIFGIVTLVSGGYPQRPEGAWTAEAIGFLTMTLPFTLYFAFCESSRWRASIGKLIFSLVVVRRSGEKTSFTRALFRNAIKFVPWEFGHMLTQQAAYAGGGDFPVWLWGPAAIAAVGPMWWLLGLFAQGETPYDRWTDVRITRSTEL